jgi:two-component system response regulator NreC
VRIVIVEDHLMFREVLRKLCEAELGHSVVAEAGNGLRAIDAVKTAKPDLVLLDLHLPGADGFEVVSEIRKTCPEIRVLVLSSHCDEFTVLRAEECEVQGFVDKNTNDIATLTKAIATVAKGEKWFSPAFVRLQTARRKDPYAFDKLLTDRERDIAMLLSGALTDAEIAERLRISAETVAKHRLTIFRKLDVANPTEFARYAREHGFTLSPPRSGDDAMLP